MYYIKLNEKRICHAFCLTHTDTDTKLHILLFTPLLNIVPEICILNLQVEQYAECTQVVTIVSNSVAMATSAVAAASAI